MKKHTKVAFSLLLVVCMLISGMPIATPAIAVGTDNQASELITETLPGEAVAADTAVLNEDAVIVEEDTALRGEYEKHFFMSDGSYQVALYNEPVHKMEGGEWVEIDNTLTLKTATDGTARYATTDGLTDVSFSQSFDDQLITMQQDDYFVSWGVQAFSSSLSTNTSAELVKPIQAELVTSEQSTFSVEEQKTLATKSSSTIQYRNALRQNVDLEYVVLPSRVKENIILQSAQDISYYVVTVYTENLSARLLENREIEFYNDSDEVIFTMTSPYMYDNAGELSEDIAVEMVSKGDGCYFIKMTPNAQWLSDENRAYPVVIDPQVSVDTTRTNIIDNYVLKGSGVQNRNLDRLYIGNRSEGLTRAFIKYKIMPTLPEGSTITAATMALTLTNGTDTAASALAYQVGDDWESGTIEWDNMPELGTPQASNISHNNMTQYRFSCLEAVKDWYNGSITGQNQNYGIMLRYSDETIEDYNAVYSADYTDESKRPSLVITYGGSGGGVSFASAKTIYLDDSEYVNTLEEGEKRYFKFTPTETAEYVIMSNHDTGDPKVWLYDSGHSQILSHDDVAYPSNKNFWLKYELHAGNTYFIGVGHAVSQVGGYYFMILKSANLANGFYHVKNKHSGKRLDICGPVEQIYVHQWTAHTGEQEKWLLQSHIENNQIAYYTIRSQYGENKYIGISSTNTGENNVQLFDSICDETKWNIYSTPSGTYYLEPFTAKGRGIYAANATTGTKMQLSWIILNRTNTKWFMNPYTYSDASFTFSAFDVGDSSEDEVAIVKQWMESFGYTDIGSYNNATDVIGAQAIKEIGRYSDVVYINGHGEKYANMQIRNAAGSVVEYLCADLSCTERHYHDVPRVVIGAERLPYSISKTNSYWNIRTKWGILAQCDQLDFGTVGAGEHWNGLSSAEMWVRTMLGDGEQVHGYLGYYNRAPGGSTHTDRLQTFFSYYGGMSLTEAWAMAHTRISGSSDWAAVFLSDHEDDFFTDMSGVYNGDDHDAYYASRSVGSAGIDFSAKAVSAEQMVSQISDGQYPTLTTSSAMTRATNKIYADLQTTLISKRPGVLNIENNGMITYHAEDRNWGKNGVSYTLSDIEAVSIAEKILNEQGLLPSDDYRTGVAQIQRVKLDLTGEQKYEPDTVEYVVTFYRTYNGVDILSDQEDGILVSFDANGLTELRYLWREIKHTLSAQNKEASVLTITQASKIYQAEMMTGCSILANNKDISANNANVNTAYLQIDGVVRPVYVFSTDANYTNSIFVDMYTGEVLYP